MVFPPNRGLVIRILLLFPVLPQLCERPGVASCLGGARAGPQTRGATWMKPSTGLPSYPQPRRRWRTWCGDYTPSAWPTAPDCAAAQDLAHNPRYRCSSTSECRLQAAAGHTRPSAASARGRRAPPSVLSPGSVTDPLVSVPERKETCTGTHVRPHTGQRVWHVRSGHAPASEPASSEPASSKFAGT